jgi:C4-dicarboxylate-specific signal transduction histidine kinase
MTGIFVLDALTDVDLEVADLYVIPILLISRAVSSRGVLLVASICVPLTVAGNAVSPGDFWGYISLLNMFFAITVIGFTAYLIVRSQSAELALRNSQDQLARFMRITALGQLVASITHEVNQPLAAVVANADASLRWLAMTPPNVAEVRSALEDVVKHGERASAVIQRVRAMVRKEPPQMNPIDVNEAVLEMVALAHAEAERRSVTLETDLSSDLPPVFGDRVQVQQVILNLVLNALEATGDSAAGERRVAIKTGLHARSEVSISVHDSGKGLPDDIERVFETFYTTKPDGMGMGLSISRSIVEGLGGRLWATRNLPRGAIFQLTLPTEREPDADMEQTPSSR